jgi:hypothetical protein
MANEIATEIRNQIGSKALYMIGAKHLVADENSLSFKIMRNSKGVSHVKITLTSIDEYNMEFLSCRAGKIKIKSEVKGRHFNELCKAIELNTGLYTKLY